MGLGSSRGTFQNRRIAPHGGIAPWGACFISQFVARLAPWRDPRPVVHLLHIGKTGGTALKHALMPYVEGQHYRIVLHGHGTRLTDVPAGDAVVFALRDPVSRFVSGFQSRLRQGKPRYDRPWSAAEAVAFGEFPTPNALALALSDREAARRGRAVDAMRAIGHVRTPYWYWLGDESRLRSRRADILEIAFQETLSADFERWKCVLGLPKHVVLPDSDYDAHRTPRGLDSALDDAARTNLRAWYVRDYAALAICQEFAAAAPFHRRHVPTGRGGYAPR